MNNSKKITKMSVAIDTVRHVLLTHEGEHIRQEFIKQFEAKVREVFNEEPKKNLAPSYWQMIKYEVDQKAGGKYRHHKNRYVKASDIVQPPTEEVNTTTTVDIPTEMVDDVPTIEAVIPADAKWMVTIDETTEYFTNRDDARKYKKDNGGTLAKVA